MARKQALLALLLTAIIVGACSGLAAVSRRDAFVDALDRQIDERYHQRKCVPWNHGPFIDLEDRLLLDELMHADYSKGGVYLIGSSNLKWATRLWSLPADQRKLIHNYGIGASSHTCQLLFLRHLIEEKGLLSAGGEKTLIVLGLSYHCTRFGCEPQSFWTQLWERHGLFACSQEEGIHSLDRSDLSRQWRVERARLLGITAKLWKYGLVLGENVLRGGAPARIHDAEEYRRLLIKFMGSKWPEKMDAEVSQFSAMLDYLRGHHVKVVAVLLPHGSWEQQLPFSREYNKQVGAVCQEKGILLFDWSRRLSDEDFGDSTHANLDGINKLESAFTDIAAQHLAETGALK